MKSFQIYNAYCSLMKLYKCASIPFQLRVLVSQLKINIEHIAMCYEKSELDIVNKYGDKDENGNAVIKNSIVSISDKKLLEKATLEIDALRNEDVVLLITPIEIKMSDCEKTDITSEDIEKLLLVIKFI